MNDYKTPFDKLQEKFEIINETTLFVENSSAKMFEFLEDDEKKSLQVKFDNKINSTQEVISTIHKFIKEVHCDLKTPEGVITNNLLMKFISDFRSVLDSYNKAIRTYDTLIKEKITRQNKIVSGTEPERAKDESSDISTENAFLQKTLNSRTALEYVEHKHVDVLQLEKNINELHQLFLDMDILTSRQGELIDDIESNINTTNSNVVKSTKNLSEAKEFQKKTRSKMCCFMITAIVVLCFLGGLIGAIVKFVK